MARPLLPPTKTAPPKAAAVGLFGGSVAATPCFAPPKGGNQAPTIPRAANYQVPQTRQD